jgi:tetratricopeptide (TPR) repeat protein
MGLDAEARSAATEGVVAARSVGDVSSESRLLAMLAAVSYDAGELPKAELAAREAVQRVVDEESSGGMYARAVLADILVAKEEWDEADRCLEHIVNGADTAVMVQQAAVFTRAHIRVKRGLLDEARAMLESLNGAGEELSMRVILDALSAVVYARLGLFAKAERAADAAYAKSGGMIDAAFSRTLLLSYELERLKISPHDDDARRRVEVTLQLIGDATERGRSWIASNGDVRLAVGSVRDALSDAGFRAPAEREPAPELVLARGGEEARIGARSLALGHRHTLRQILLGLVAAPGGTEVSVEGVFALGWPGERVAQRALRNRVHVALATLRRELLGPWLRRTRSGYSIDPTLTILRR